METNEIDTLEARVRADLAARDFAALAADASALCAALSVRGRPSAELMAWGLEQAGKGYEGLLQYAQAEACYRQALAARRERGLLDEFALVVSLTHLARVCEEAGRYREASDVYEEALANCRRCAAARPQHLAICLENLAGVARKLGRFGQADALLTEAVGVRRALPPDAQLGQAYSELAILHDANGRLDSARALHEQAVAVCRSCGDENALASVLNNQALFFQLTGRSREAEGSYLEVTELLERSGKTRHPHLGAALNNLAEVYRCEGRLGEACETAGRALAIYRAVRDESHPEVAKTKKNLALIHRALGDRAQARRLLDDALSAMRSREHVDPEASVTILNAAAKLAGEARDWRMACDLLREQGQVQNGVLHEHLSILTERDRLRYVQTLMEEVWLAASAAATAGGQVAELIDIAFRWTLQRKALVVQAERAQRDAVMGGRYPALRAKFAALGQLREELGGLQLHGGSADRLAALSEEAEALERELVRAVPEMRLEKALQGADPSHIAQALPETACLIEFLRYRCYDWAGTQGAGGCWRGERYAAFVLAGSPQVHLQLADLGDSSEIDALVNRLRARVGDQRGAVYDEPDGEAATDWTAELTEKLWLRLERSLAEAGIGPGSLLILAPDGELTRVPFEAIALSTGAYLADLYRVRYVDTGRELLRTRFAAQPAACTPPLVVADPDFDWAGEVQERSSAPDGTRAAEVQEPGNAPEGAREGGQSGPAPESRRSRDWSGALHFTRLPGTRAEAQYLEQLLGVRAFTDRWAVEALLKRHPSPRILHIATHGVFLPNQPMSADLAPARSWESCENPLLRSALALAAANLTGTHGVLPEEAGDGILTALEVAGLDLLGTELVVLSACETGLGQYAVGEGVYGLRRAFVLAGARSLVISLWKVSDVATALLMKHFYDGLVVRGMAKDIALAEAKRWLRTLPAVQLAALIREPAFAGLAADAQRFLQSVQPPFDHPRYWAAFILIGDPAPL